MADSPSDNFFERPQEPTRRSAKYILMFLGLLILIIISVGAYQYLGSQQQTPSPTPTPLPTFPQEEAPTPTAPAVVTPTGQQTVSVTPTKSTISPTAIKTTISPTTTQSSTIDKTTGLDRSTLTIEVLNGSGTGGAAKKASDILTSLGYEVVATGNAPNFNYETTQINVKTTKKNFGPLLNKDLGSTYTTEVNATPLPASSTADAQVIVGKN